MADFTSSLADSGLTVIWIEGLHRIGVHGFICEYKQDLVLFENIDLSDRSAIKNSARF
jgi:hypothetical protein